MRKAEVELKVFTGNYQGSEIRVQCDGDELRKILREIGGVIGHGTYSLKARVYSDEKKN